jgi:hypothetical protein
MSPAPLDGHGVTRARVLAYVRAHPGAVLVDIAASIPCTEPGAYRHLWSLQSDGLLASQTRPSGRGNRRRVHWYVAGTVPPLVDPVSVSGPAAPSLRLPEQGAAIESITTQTAMLRALQAELSDCQARLDRTTADLAAARAELARIGSGRLVPRDRRARE